MLVNDPQNEAIKKKEHKISHLFDNLEFFLLDHVFALYTLSCHLNIGVSIVSAVLLHLFLPCEEAGSLDKIDVSPSVASLRKLTIPLFFEDRLAQNLFTSER